MGGSPPGCPKFPFQRGTILSFRNRGEKIEVEEMSAPHSLSTLSSGSSHHPIWPIIILSSKSNHAAASSGILPSPTCLRRRINLLSSLPTYTRLGDGETGDDGSNQRHQGQQSEQPRNLQQEKEGDLAATYSTSQTASAAYKSGLLKSDYNISSNAQRIRLAFRYHYLRHEDEQKNNTKLQSSDEKIDDELLFLCWIRQDGIPCHFRKLTPVEKDNGGNKGSSEESAPTAKRLRGGRAQDDQKAAMDVLVVNEHDVIENTFPGHAFVFCRRVENIYNHQNRIVDDINSSPLIVHDDNGRTIFLRRTKQRHDRVISDKSTSSSSSSSSEKEDVEKLQEEGKGGNNGVRNDDKNDEQYEWEAYLVVGGFRPGPMLHIPPRTAVEEKAEESCSKVDSDDEKSAHDDKDGSDDNSDDEMELQVQLVTIRRVSVEKQQNHATTSLRGAGRSENSAVDASKSISQPDQTKMDDLKVTLRLAQIDPTPVDMSLKHYDQVTLGGWPCRIEPGCFDSSRKDSSAKGKSSLQSRFETDITAACQSLPPMARQKLQQSTPIWINKSHMWGPRVAPIRGRDACFHPGAHWLSRNGDNPLKCGGVEFYDAKHYLSDCDHWGPGGLILHELSHAWHNIHIANGYDNEQIKKCYDLAMKDGLYDCVRVHGAQGPKCKAYACTNPMEYFAELSVAFLGGLDDTLEHNKWFPFNRKQLREHDPRAFDLLCHMWGVVVDDDDDVESHIHTGSERGGGEESKET
ncbi:hypothetical protein ACHAXM_000597 [Skeletonema potamos]